MTLFSRQDRERIEQAIAEVERHTAGEIVVAVVRESSRYDGSRSLGTALWTLGVTLVVHGVWPALPALWLVLGQVPLAGLMWVVLGWAPLRRLLVPASRAERAVAARAMQLFAEHGVHNTRDRSGLLLLISELERRVVILGDTGIHARIGDSGWDAHVRTIVEGVRTGRSSDAVLAVLRSLGDVLAEHFPRRAGDVDELSNAVVEERS